MIKTKTRKIGIDIDEVLSETNVRMLFFLKEKFSINLTFDEIIDFNFDNIDKLKNLKISGVELWDMFNKENIKDVSVVAGSKDGLNFLKQNGFELYVITGRRQSLEKDTKSWLKSNFGSTFKDIVFTNHDSIARKNKSEFCLSLGIDVLIDDNIDFALDVATKGVIAYLFEKPWNKFRTETHENIIRVKSWDDIIKI